MPLGLAEPGGATWERTRCPTFHGDDPLGIDEAPDRPERVILHLSGAGADGPAIGVA